MNAIIKAYSVLTLMSICQIAYDYSIPSIILMQRKMSKSGRYESNILFSHGTAPGEISPFLSGAGLLLKPQSIRVLDHRGIPWRAYFHLSATTGLSRK